MKNSFSYFILIFIFFINSFGFCQTIKSYNEQNPIKEEKKDSYWDIAWHARMADYGDSKSQWILGQAYEYGKNTAINPSKSLYFYEKACLNNLPESCMHLGELFEQKKWGLSNEEKEILFFEKAASLNFIPAQLHISEIYKEKNEFIKAHYWLNIALKQLFPDEDNLESVSPDLAYLSAYILNLEENTQE